jgi:YihY family inner membrane protein
MASQQARDDVAVATGNDLPATGAVDWFDGLQRRHPVLGFPLAVQKRYVEDRGGWLAAIITYYGFFALIPLLLVLVTVMSIVLRDDPTMLDRILNAVWDQLPFVGEDIRRSVQPVAGDPRVVVVAMVVALWGGAKAMKVCQDSLNRMWGVPRYRRPGFASRLWRGLAVIVLFGVGIVGTALVTGITLGLRLPLLATVGTAVATVVANTAITLGLYRLLVDRRLTARQVLPGAIVVGFGTYVLTMVGGLHVQRVIANASSLYGSFGTMIGLFAWIALTVQVFVYGTLIDVVRSERLWPRSIAGHNLGAADRRAIALTAERSLLASREQLADGSSAPRASHPT